MSDEELAQRLAAFLRRHHGARDVRIEGLRLLTGGASRQTWAFDAIIEYAGGQTESVGLVMRSDARRGPAFMSRETECRLLQAAAEAGVPVPRIHAMGDESLGVPFFLMERIEGETIPRRLLRDEQYARAREVMTRQLGAILASIHRIPAEVVAPLGLPAPATGTPAAESETARWEATYRLITPDPHPAFELAFRWLRAHMPPAADRALVHGDFRIGNIIFGPEGARAVLDWELAHVGDPMEDLGWLCVRSWRFGNDALPVGGIGTREELFAAYEAAGGQRPDPRAVRWWELFGNLRWGIICISQVRAYLDGQSASVELAAIGRRTAETEWELMRLMEES
jgi:aminoglycoside phosphotransferase (APT) family kinase protein